MRKTTTMIFSILLLALTIGFTACGSAEEEAKATTAIAGGCTAVYPWATICQEYRDIYSSFVATAESQCVSDGTNTVTWSSDACSTTGADGYCLATGLGGQPSDSTMRMYLYLEGVDQSTCDDSFGGTFVAL